MRLLGALLVALLFIFSQSTLAKESAEDVFLRKMPLRKKIGQMFMIGFQGTKIEEGLGETIDTVSPGGLVVFGRNIETARQISDLLLAAQSRSSSSSRVPLLVATDQEGGDVIRIKTSAPLPSALAFGKTDRPDLAEASGFATGRLMKTLGFNMNLAPVLDVSDPKQMMFIGTRTYGNDPALVGRMAVSFSEGLIKAGVLPTGKHFPGHGGITEDSHEGIAEKHSSAEELRARDLIPFAKMQESFASRWAVMLGHVVVPSLDPTRSPASLSKPIVTDLLRKEMGFEGLVLTDDIAMGGAAQVKDTRERVLKAIDAGADMVMVAWNRKLQHDLISVVEKAVRNGRIPLSRINASVRRIIDAKRLYANNHLRPPTDNEIRQVLKNPKFSEIGAAMMMARFQRSPDKDEIEFREFANDKHILLFSANERFPRSFREGLPKGRKFRVFNLDVNRSYDINKVMLANPEAVGVFYMSGYQAAKIAAAIGEDVARRMLLVTVEAPGIIKNAGDFRNIADVYYRHPDLGRLVANFYFGNENLEIRAPASSASTAKTVGFRPDRAE
jgi:beta-N-acetylhexosaminidase